MYFGWSHVGVTWDVVLDVSTAYCWSSPGHEVNCGARMVVLHHLYHKWKCCHLHFKWLNRETNDNTVLLLLFFFLWSWLWVDYFSTCFVSCASSPNHYYSKVVLRNSVTQQFWYPTLMRIIRACVLWSWLWVESLQAWYEYIPHRVIRLQSCLNKFSHLTVLISTRDQQSQDLSLKLSSKAGNRKTKIDH